MVCFMIFSLIGTASSRLKPYLQSSFRNCWINRLPFIIFSYLVNYLYFINAIVSIENIFQTINRVFQVTFFNSVSEKLFYFVV